MLLLEPGALTRSSPRAARSRGPTGASASSTWRRAEYSVLLGERLLKQPIQDKNPVTEWRESARNEARHCAVEEGKPLI